MIHLKLGPKRLWIELWSNPFSFKKWDLHFEHRTTLFDTRAWWVGPFHILMCDARPSRLISADSSLNQVGFGKEAHNG